MKLPLRLLTGVLLTGFSVACTSLDRAAEASQDANQDGRSGTAATPISGSGAAGADWKLGPPVAHENLTVFPVLADGSTTTDEFITLDEGLKSGKVTVSEIGADGRSRVLGRDQQVSDRAEVNRLMVTNNSGKTLVLIGGEIVVGGKQDRIVGHDCIISSTNKPAPIDVFCVEHGRWQVGRSQGQTQGSGSVSVSGDNALLFVPAAGLTMAAPKVREKAQAGKDQSGVWAEVAKTQSANGVRSSSGTLNDVFEDKQVSAKLGAFDRELRDKLVARNVVGAVVAINGELVSADVFANSAMFQAYWPKLLKSYALQAVSTPTAGKAGVDATSAAAFLSRARDEGSTTGDAKVYRLKQNDSDAAASFELESITGGKLIHFNRVSKK